MGQWAPTGIEPMDYDDDDDDDLEAQINVILYLSKLRSHHQRKLLPENVDIIISTFLGNSFL